LLPIGLQQPRRAGLAPLSLRLGKRALSIAGFRQVLEQALERMGCLCVGFGHAWLEARRVPGRGKKLSGSETGQQREEPFAIRPRTHAIGHERALAIGSFLVVCSGEAERASLRHRPAALPELRRRGTQDYRDHPAG
jgi:hypothetical protein